MGAVWNNKMELDYVRLSLLAASYFILNYEEIAMSRGRYVYDLKVDIDGIEIIISAIYRPATSTNGIAAFFFKAESVDVDMCLSFVGAYDVACSFAKDFIGEYLSRVKRTSYQN